MGVVHQPLPSFVYDVSNKNILGNNSQSAIWTTTLFGHLFKVSFLWMILIGPNLALDPNLKRDFT